MESELRSLESALSIITNKGHSWHPNDKIVTPDNIEEVKTDIKNKKVQIEEVKNRIKDANPSYGSVSEIRNY